MDILLKPQLGFRVLFTIHISSQKKQHVTSCYIRYGWGYY